MAVIQIGHVPPVAEAVAERAVRLVEEPLGVMLCKPGIGGRVVIDHVDDALHAPVVDGVDQTLEIVQRAELGVHGAVVTDGVGAAERALSVLFAGRMDGQQPDDVRAERLDAVEIRLHGGEGARFGIIADIDGVQNLIADRFFCIDSHKNSLPNNILYLYCTQIMEKGKSANFIKSEGATSIVFLRL